MTERGILPALRRALRLYPRCERCGRPIRGRAYSWRGKKFCSKTWKEKYRKVKFLTILLQEEVEGLDAQGLAWSRVLEATIPTKTQRAAEYSSLLAQVGA